MRSRFFVLLAIAFILTINICTDKKDSTEPEEIEDVIISEKVKVISKSDFAANLLNISSDGICWHVFNITSSGNLVTKNILLNTPP